MTKPIPTQIPTVPALGSFMPLVDTSAAVLSMLVVVAGSAIAMMWTMR